MSQTHGHQTHLALRPAHIAMDLPRLGSHYPMRLSFMRVLIRTIIQDKWHIERTHFEVDEHGVGDIVYTISTPNDVFSFVAFSHDLDPSIRSDRVIAERWDLTATLCVGRVDQLYLEQLRSNVPKQEKGRFDSRSIVLTRANQSSRNYEYVCQQLASGQQPSEQAIAETGYLYRTTAVYGSGKFGMCDWLQVKELYPNMSRPFTAEMLVCYMIREASFDLVEHAAKQQSPKLAVPLNPNIKRYFGIGNATGLGMAPFLINHPLLINQWIECREIALARVLTYGLATLKPKRHLRRLLLRAQQHLREIKSNNEPQNEINENASSELTDVIGFLESYYDQTWNALINFTSQFHLDTQEILNSCLIELFPGLVDDLADTMCVNESYELRPEQSLSTLKSTFETAYNWALAVDFNDAKSRKVFWYRSSEKMEPRLGEVGVDDGVELAMNMSICKQVRDCYDYICEYLERNPNDRVAHFLLQFSNFRSIVRRVQTMANTNFGEIRANLLDAEVAPTQLMRCKLSFFGVSKFDPQSRLWVRNTMYQGAPTVEDLQCQRTCNLYEDWSFPLMPDVANASV